MFYTKFENAREASICHLRPSSPYKENMSDLSLIAVDSNQQHQVIETKKVSPHEGRVHKRDEELAIIEDDEELRTLISLRTTLSSVLLMLENARDDIISFNNRCRQLNEASSACRQATIQNEFESEAREELTSNITRTVQDGNVSNLAKSIHLGKRSKP